MTRLIGLLVAILGLTAAGWTWLSMPLDAVSTLNAKAGSPAEQRQSEILRDNIDKASDPALKTVFDEINAKHFGGALPSVPVRWEPRLAEIGVLAGRQFTLEGMFGRLGQRTVILLHPHLQTDIDALDRALSHEMVHARLFFLGDTTTDHGPAFRAELKRLSEEGAFPGIASTEEERTTLRAWLEAESARLTSERDALAELNPELQRERAAAEMNVDDAARRDAYNLRAQAANTRTEAFNEALAHYNAEVTRYNLMVAYPDGLDETTRATPIAAGAKK